MRLFRSARRGSWWLSAPAIMATGLLAAPAMSQTTSTVSPDGLVKVELKPITPLGSSAFNTGLFSSFSGWTVTQGASAAGSLTTGTYKPKVLLNGAGHVIGGGAEIDATYTHPLAPSNSNRLQYIQVASTTGFGTAFATPHLDPLNNDDTLPFYWTSAEAAANRNGNGAQVKFADQPQAPFAGLKNGSVSFTGRLFVSEWDGAKQVTVHNGFSWGYDMSLATDGKATGTFSNPSPTCPPATCTGVGTNAFTWGSGLGGPPSSLGFSGANFTPVIDQNFVIGNLSFFNGTIASGSGVDSLSFGADVSFGFGSSFGTPFHLDATLSIINTPNGGVDPRADADIVSFASGGFKANFNVLEGQSASVPLLARLLPASDVVAEKQLGDASFDGFTLAFAGFGDVTGGGFVTAVPEPTPTVLLTFGLAFIWGMHRRRHRRPQG